LQSIPPLCFGISHSARLQTAVLNSAPGHNAFAMAKLTNYNIAIVAFVCIGGFTYGYAFAVFATSIGQPGFYAYFNLDRELKHLHYLN
jgi:hypothetical protein